jgi:hypothetical protein
MKLFLVLLLVLFVVPVFGQITWDQGVQQCQTQVSLTIPAWAQVVCQDPDGITFSNNNVTGTPSSDGSNNGGGDWWNDQLNGYYQSIASGLAPAGCDSKASTDPWAGAEYITGDPDGSPTGLYYEALDYAHHYVRTNTNITGTVASFTSLGDGGGNSIPAWFTMGFAPFWDAGSQITTTTIPFDGQGGFLSGNGAVNANMSATPVALNSANYNITAPAFGTITLHARILRKGMMDVAGTYTGTITVSYQ